MKKRIILGVLSLALFLSLGTSTLAASGVGPNGISYSANLYSSYVKASITTKQVVYPTSKVEIWFDNGSGVIKRVGNGTSYGSYSNISVSTNNSNQMVKDNKCHFKAGSFQVSLKAD